MCARHGVAGVIIFFGFLLSACSDSGNDSRIQEAYVPEEIVPGQECHVCGMEIAGFPGPKAQAFVLHHEQPFRFCSTRDFFSWLLQPETASIVRAAFVQDMTHQDWNTPRAARYVAAEKAWYVVGHPLKGAMGATLASFAGEQAAQDFAGQQGGQVLGYSAITLELLASLDGHRHHE